MGAIFSFPPPTAPIPTAALCAPNETDLRLRYDAIAAQLPARGFDAAALAASSRLFDERASPRHYADPPWSLPPFAVRVLALSLADESLTDERTRRTAGLALRAAAEVSRALPGGARSWLPRLKALHATLFHPGLSPQSDTRGKLCHLPLPVPPARCWQRTGIGGGSPSDAELRHELRAARRLAASVHADAFQFEVDRLVLTSSGVLLLLLRPYAPARASRVPRGCVRSLRAAAAAAFPLAARKQTTGLIHVSLLRILSLPAADAGGRRTHGPNATAALALGALVARLSARLAGLPLRFRGLLYVRESQIMTLDGERHRLPFAGARGHAPVPSLANVLARGGTRPGYDHDRDGATHKP